VDEYAASKHPEDVRSYISNLENFVATRKGPRPPSKRYHEASNPTLGILLLQTLQKMHNMPDISIRHPSQLSVAEQVELPFLAFYAEWRAFLGPDPDEPMAPPEPFRPNLEAMMFVTLFPYGIGHYLGPEGHPTPLTFEEYAEHRLAIDDGRFRHSAQWLLWVLSRTGSRDLAAVVNCALMLFHKMKARHLGEGSVQSIDISEDFEACRLVEGKLVPENAQVV
jgi:hypothetical protein